MQCFRYEDGATPRDFEIFAPYATYEDPLLCPHGYVCASLNLHVGKMLDYFIY